MHPQLNGQRAVLGNVGDLGRSHLRRELSFSVAVGKVSEFCTAGHLAVL